VQWRTERLHCELQEESQSVVSIDMRDKLWRAPIELHENGLLGSGVQRYCGLLKQ